jgi:hypothetical protein
VKRAPAPLRCLQRESSGFAWRESPRSAFWITEGIFGPWRKSAARPRDRAARLTRGGVLPSRPPPAPLRRRRSALPRPCERQHWARSTEPAALGPQHWARSTGPAALSPQHWARSTGPAALGPQHWARSTGPAALGRRRGDGCQPSALARLGAPEHRCPTGSVGAATADRSRDWEESESEQGDEAALEASEPFTPDGGRGSPVLSGSSDASLPRTD